MQMYHGTSASNLTEIVEYEGLLCMLDLGVQRLLKLQKKGYFSEELSQSETERRIWDGARKRKENDPSYKYSKDVHVYVSSDPHSAYLRCRETGVILGFEVDSSMLIDGNKVYRSVPLTHLNRVLYLEGTDLSFAREALRDYDVPYAFYDYKTEKIHSGERSQVSI